MGLVLTNLASDAFDRANEDPVASPWVTGAGSLRMVLTGNVLLPNTVGSDAWAYLDGGIVWPNDQWSKSKVSVTGTSGGGAGAGPIVRKAAGATETYYRLVADHAASNNVVLHRIIAGAVVSIATRTLAWTDTDVWELRAQGPILTIVRNNFQVGNSVFDSLIASGFPGLAYSSTETAASLNDWEGGAIFPSGMVGPFTVSPQQRF